MDQTISKKTAMKLETKVGLRRRGSSWWWPARAAAATTTTIAAIILWGCAVLVIRGLTSSDHVISRLPLTASMDERSVLPHLATTSSSSLQDWWPGGNQKQKQKQEPRHTIPRHFIFVDTRYSGIHEMEPHVIANVNHTIRLFRQAWNDSNAPVYFYGHQACVEAINATKPELLFFYQNETVGPYRSDICRTAALKLRGGLYTDNDMQVVVPYIPPNDNITFVSSVQYDNQGLAMSFLFATQGHDVFSNVLDLLLGYYHKTVKLHSHLGTSIYKNAYDALPTELKSFSTLLLREINLNNVPRYNDFPRLGGVGCCCDYAMEDPQAKQIFFYSRMLGSGSNCDFPNGNSTISQEPLRSSRRRRSSSQYYTTERRRDGSALLLR